MKRLLLLCSLYIINTSTITFAMESDEEPENRFGKIERKLSKSVKSGNPAQMIKLLEKLDPQEINTILSGASRTDLNQKTLLEVAINQLAVAEKEEQSTINKDRVKGALISMGLAGVGIYNIVAAFKTSSSSSTGNSTDESSSESSINYSEAIPNLIGSLYLIWASGKELWKVGKNHYAQRKKEKAHSILHVLKEHTTPPSTPAPQRVAESQYALHRMSLHNQNEIKANKKTINELTEQLAMLTKLISEQPHEKSDQDAQQLVATRDTLQRLLNITSLERQKRKQKKIAELPVEQDEEYSRSQDKRKIRHPDSPTSSPDLSESKPGKVRKRTAQTSSSSSREEE